MIHIWFVVLPNSLLLDIAGPAEAFRIANQTLTRQGKSAAFDLHFIGPQTQVISSIGLPLAELDPLPCRESLCLNEQDNWIVLVGR